MTIRQIRRRIGITLEEFGDRFGGFSASYVCYLEHGRGPIPIRMLRALRYWFTP